MHAQLAHVRHGAAVVETVAEPPQVLRAEVGGLGEGVDIPRPGEIAFDFFPKAEEAFVGAGGTRQALRVRVKQRYKRLDIGGISVAGDFSRQQFEDPGKRFTIRLDQPRSVAADPGVPLAIIVEDPSRSPRFGSACLEGVRRPLGTEQHLVRAPLPKFTVNPHATLAAEGRDDV